jgi:hypothetical protein
MPSLTIVFDFDRFIGYSMWHNSNSIIMGNCPRNRESENRIQEAGKELALLILNPVFLLLSPDIKGTL